MKLKGIELKGTYKVKFEDDYLKVYDDKGNEIYFENSAGDWSKREYDDNGNETYYENAIGYWSKRENDEKGNRIYFENNYGIIIDKRPKPIKELTVSEVSKLLGYEIKIVKEK